MPELSETPLGYMRSPNGNVIELFQRGREFVIRTYMPVAGPGPDGGPSKDGDKNLTDQQADEYHHIMASCGGVVADKRIWPRLVAEEEKSA